MEDLSLKKSYNFAHPSIEQLNTARTLIGSHTAVPTPRSAINNGLIKGPQLQNRISTITLRNRVRNAANAV